MHNPFDGVIWMLRKQVSLLGDGYELLKMDLRIFVLDVEIFYLKALLAIAVKLDKLRNA